MKMNRKDLYDLLHKQIKGEYCVGMHGINESRLKDFYGPLSVTDAMKDITENGLYVHSARTINGTVRFFGRLDLEEERAKVQRDLEHYYYPATNYVIVAIPSILRTESGKELFVGSPNLNSKYKEHFDTTGNETTTLLETVALVNSTVPSEFIVGTITELPDGTVEYKENPNHISKTGGLVSEEFYEQAVRNIRIELYPDKDKTEIFTNFKNVDEQVIKDFIEELEYEIEEAKYDPFSKMGVRPAFLLETLKQLLREREFYKSKEQLEQERQERERVEKTFFFNRYKSFVTNEFNCQEYYSEDDRFVRDAIKYLDDEDLKNYLERFKNKIPKEIYNEKELLIRLIKIDISLLEKSDLKDDLKTMIEISTIKGISTDIFKYVGKEILNNYSFVINVLLNTDNILNVLTAYNTKYEDSSFKYREYIGIDILNNQMFWELLNGIIRKQSPQANQFKIEKELEISKRQQEDLLKRFNTKIKIEKKDYHGYGERYVLTFNFDNEEQRKYLREIFEKEIVEKYGYNSPHRSHCIMPYFIDKFDNFTADPYKADTVGGTNLPEEIMKDILKDLVEQFHCVIKHNELEIKEEFDEEILNQIINDLNNQSMK